MPNVINLPLSAAATWKSAVADVASLPATGNSAGDVRVTLATNALYEWTGSAWVAAGGSTGISIGDPVSGGDATSLLFVDGGGNLGQDVALTYDTSSGALSLPGGSITLGSGVYIAASTGDVQMGYTANVGAGGGIAIGAGATTGSLGVSIGSGTSSYDFGVAIGQNAQGYSAGIAIGKNIDAHDHGIGIGSDIYTAVGGIAIGNGSGANNTGVVSIGTGASGGAIGGSVAIGSAATIPNGFTQQTVMIGIGQATVDGSLHFGGANGVREVMNTAGVLKGTGLDIGSGTAYAGFFSGDGSGLTGIAAGTSGALQFNNSGAIGGTGLISDGSGKITAGDYTYDFSAGQFFAQASTTNVAIDINSYTLSYAGVAAVNWGSGALIGSSGGNVNWNVGQLIPASSSNPVFDWFAFTAMEPVNGRPVLDWGAQTLKEPSSTNGVAYNWGTGVFYGYVGSAQAGLALLDVSSAPGNPNGALYYIDQTGRLVGDGGNLTNIKPTALYTSDPNYYSVDGELGILISPHASTAIIAWKPDTANTYSSAYWIDSGNSNSLTGNGGRLSPGALTAGDWATSPPTTIEEAINRISAVVSVGGTVPIP